MPAPRPRTSGQTPQVKDALFAHVKQTLNISKETTMSKDKRNGDHHETKQESSVPAGTSLTQEQSKAAPMEVPDEKVLAARKKAYGSADPDFLKGLATRIENSGIACGASNQHAVRSM